MADMDEVQVATARAVQTKNLKKIAHAKERALQGIEVLKQRIADHEAQIVKLDEEYTAVGAPSYGVTEEFAPETPEPTQ